MEAALCYSPGPGDYSAGPGNCMSTLVKLKRAEESHLCGPDCSAAENYINLKTFFKMATDILSVISVVRDTGCTSHTAL